MGQVLGSSSLLWGGRRDKVIRFQLSLFLLLFLLTATLFDIPGHWIYVQFTYFSIQCVTFSSYCTDLCYRTIQTCSAKGMRQLSASYHVIRLHADNSQCQNCQLIMSVSISTFIADLRRRLPRYWYSPALRGPRLTELRLPTKNGNTKSVSGPIASWITFESDKRLFHLHEPLWSVLVGISLIKTLSEMSLDIDTAALSWSRSHKRQ